MGQIVDLSTTIVALATALGSGSIAIIRISGKQALAIGGKIFKGQKPTDAAANTIHFGRIAFKQKEIDQVMISVFREPHSYTGEDCLEISCHANPIVIDTIIEALIKNGAVAAAPGEFTLRAFLNGKLDLTQAEAVAMLIAARTKHATKNALDHLEGAFSKTIKKAKQKLIDNLSLLEIDLDFSEENIEIANHKQIEKEIAEIEETLRRLAESYNYAKIFNSGLRLAIIGKPNSGKSTLLNVLLGENRAITSHIPGTTRDVISEEIIIENILFKLVDTAGLRETKDSLEQEGIRRTQAQIDLADLVLLLIDQSDRITQEEQAIIREIRDKYADKVLIVINKMDKKPDTNSLTFVETMNLPAVAISATNAWHIDRLKKQIIFFFSSKYGHYEEELVVTSRRQVELLNKTVLALKNSRRTLEHNRGHELAAVDLREALQCLAEIAGETINDDILNNIFSKFCVGK